MPTNIMSGSTSTRSWLLISLCLALSRSSKASAIATSFTLSLPFRQSIAAPPPRPPQPISPTLTVSPFVWALPVFAANMAKLATAALRLAKPRRDISPCSCLLITLSFLNRNVQSTIAMFAAGIVRHQDSSNTSKIKARAAWCAETPRAHALAGNLSRAPLLERRIRRPSPGRRFPRGRLLHHRRDYRQCPHDHGSPHDQTESLQRCCRHRCLLSHRHHSTIQ